MPALPLPLHSNPQEYREQGDEKLVNCYSEQISEREFRVRAINGYTSASVDVDQVNCRGAIEADGFIYAVFEGGAVFKIGQDGVRSSVGFIAGSGPVHMARNGAIPFQIGCVVSNTGRYYVIESDAVSNVDTRDLPSFNSICWVGGYFSLGVNDGRFFSTGINDARSIGGLDYATAEGNPDGLVGVFAHRLELVLMGQKTTEFWGLLSDPGATGSPFARLSGAVINKGCGSLLSVALIDNSFMWVGDDGKVYRNNNYSPERISHYGVERSIVAQADKTTIRGASYSQNGNEFYQISGDEFTWIYNAATRRWHEGKSKGKQRLNAEVHVEAWGGTYCFTKINGTMYRLDPDLTTEGDDILAMTIRFAPVRVRGLIVDNFESDFITGRSPLTGASHITDPTVELSWSDDGNATWSNPISFSMGKQGEYVVRQRATRLGRVNPKWGRTFQWVITDPCVRAISSARINEPLR